MPCLAPFLQRDRLRFREFVHAIKGLQLDWVYLSDVRIEFIGLICYCRAADGEYRDEQ